MDAKVLRPGGRRAQRAVVRRTRNVASPQQPFRSRHTSADVSGGGVSSPVVCAIPRGDRNGGGVLDGRHIRARERGWPGVVELAQAIELKRMGDPSRHRGICGRDSAHKYTRQRELPPPFPRGDGPLDALRILAGLLVLRSRGCEVRLARDPRDSSAS